MLWEHGLHGCCCVRGLRLPPEAANPSAPLPQRRGRGQGERQEDHRRQLHLRARHGLPGAAAADALRPARQGAPGLGWGALAPVPLQPCLLLWQRLCPRRLLRAAHCTQPSACPSRLCHPAACPPACLRTRSKSRWGTRCWWTCCCASCSSAPASWRPSPTWARCAAWPPRWTRSPWARRRAGCAALGAGWAAGAAWLGGGHVAGVHAPVLPQGRGASRPPAVSL